MAAIKRSHADTADHINGDLVLFHGAQHADVRDASRKSASEREPDFRAAAFLCVGKRAQPMNGSLQPIRIVCHVTPLCLRHSIALPLLAGLSG